MRFAPDRMRRPRAAVAAGLVIAATVSATEAPIFGPPTAIHASAAQNEVCSPQWLADLYPRQLPASAARAPLLDALAFGAVAGDRAAGMQRLFVRPRLSGGPTWTGRAAAPAVASDLGLTGLSQDTSVATRPNDEWYGLQQDSLGNVLHAQDAWQVSYGRDDAVIAVISDGVDLGHPDLADKIWQNPGEIPDNGIDDDGNGYVDDVNGWDFGGDTWDKADGDNDPSPIALGAQTVPRSGNRGTQMAGIAAASTLNGIGIAGVSWGARIMPIKTTFKYTPPGDTKFWVSFWPKHITEGVCYAARNGADVILIGGLPIGGNVIREESTYKALSSMAEAIGFAGQPSKRRARGVPVVVPAGECNIDNTSAVDTSCPEGSNPPIFPATSSNRNVVGVTAMRVDRDNAGIRRPTMSVGSWVDIAAPGEGFYTTVNRENEGEPYQMVGTRDRYPKVDDFAAAHIAGVVGAMTSINPTLTPIQVLGHLCRNASRDEAQGTFELGGDGWLRNDVFGCGVVNFEQTVRNMPFKIRLRNAGSIIHEFVPLDQGEALRPLTNPYINVGWWQIDTETTWLDDMPAPQRVGQVSTRMLRLDIESLDRWAGGLSSSSRIPPQEVRVCKTDPVITHQLHFTAEDCALGNTSGCLCLQLQLHVAGHVSHAYLPFAVSGVANSRR
ncbi:MAG: S8 family serine peptidase [Ardenticatenales bacterium]